MNKVILCEGPTDAILLSYYLEKVAGWKFCHKPPQEVNIKNDDFDQSISWYQKEQDRLLICAVGGKDRFGEFFNKKLRHPFIDSNAFSKIALILDRDKSTINSLEMHASNLFKAVITSMKNNEWIKNTYIDSYEMEQSVEALLVIIPTDHQGALETLMLDSISEDPNDAVIVDKVRLFISEIRSIATKYINSERKALKATLGVTWAVQYPEKVFKLIDEQIKSVKWEESAALKKCFEKLIEI